MTLLALAVFVALCAWPRRPPPSTEQRLLAGTLTRCPSWKDRPHVR